ncbi:hypothetical protein ABIE44_000144 [Marmoricola sp. OAE513]
MPISLPSEAGEALEGALGDPFVDGVGLGRVGADHDDAGTALEAAQQRGEELLQGDERFGGGQAGGVEDEALVLLLLARGGGARDAEVVQGGGQRGSQATVAAHDDGAVDQGSALGVPLELLRGGQAEVLHEHLADRAGAEGLVAVAHRGFLASGRGVSLEVGSIEM